jgi:long-chain acyl-CoA synthetase
MRTGLGYLFDGALAESPDKVAIRQGEKSVTFRELDARANRVGRALARSGVGPGDRVAFLFENDYRFLECYFGVFRAGAVAVSVNHRLSGETVTYILNHSDVGVLLCSPGQARRAARLAGDAPQLRHLIGVGVPATDITSYEGWIRDVSGGPLDHAVSDEEIAIHAYTAGSTGSPKACLLTHGAQLWSIDAAVSALGFTAKDCGVVATPLGHKNATMSIKRLLRVGGSVVLLPAFDPEAYLAAIAHHRVTCTTGVPAVYQMLVDRDDLFHRYDVRSVRLCHVGSAPLSPALQAAIHARFPSAQLREVYGATEAGSLIQPPDGSPGLVPVSGTEARVIRQDGSDCSPDEVGELLLRNPGVAQGYHKNPEATAERIREGWYHSGDLVRRSREGRFFIVGRRDDMIIIGGEKVYPKEIEEILLRHPQVADVCVVPVRHPGKGQVPVAFVVLRGPHAVTESALQEFFVRHGAPFAVIRRAHFIESLPLTAPGKVDRSVLRVRAEAMGWRDSGRVSNPGLV